MKVLFVNGPCVGQDFKIAQPLNVLKIAGKNNLIHTYQRVTSHPFDYAAGYDVRYEYQSSYQWGG